MRAVAILTGPETHLDHLGVLSGEMGVPLIVTDPAVHQLAQEFYPNIDVTLKGMDELSIEHLASYYDLIFESGKFFAAELKPFIELLYKKKMRFVYCPHGNSDKGHSLSRHAEQDVSLVYGGHLADLLQRTGASDKTGHFVRTGNYRYPYYLQRKAFYDRLAEEKVFCKFSQSKPTILYAPTWQDRENPTSFFTTADSLIEQLCDAFNLLVKPHPFLFENNPALWLSIQGKYEAAGSVQFLTEFPPIYPLLARCDAYLGDFSSIGYDFLAFDKPLYFLCPKDNASLLYSCGRAIGDISEVGNILKSTFEASKKEFSAERKRIYSYAFGEEIEPKLIYSRILHEIG